MLIFFITNYVNTMGDVCPPGDNWSQLERFSAATTCSEKRVLLASSEHREQRPGMLLTVLQCTTQSATTKNYLVQNFKSAIKIVLPYKGLTFKFSILISNTNKYSLGSIITRVLRQKQMTGLNNVIKALYGLLQCLQLLQYYFISYKLNS